MMELILTNHAKKRMLDRGIELKHIKETIDLPNYTIRKDNKVEAYKEINGKTLKVVYIQKAKFIKIITLIWK
jgi:hypothetical protein